MVSRTHFEVLGLGLEASIPRKLPCPRLENSTIFEPLKFRWKTPDTLRKICKNLFLFSSSRNRLKKIFEDLFCLKNIFEDLFFLKGPEKKILKTFFFLRTLASMSLVLGLERVCPWPRALCSRLHFCQIKSIQQHSKDAMLKRFGLVP